MRYALRDRRERRGRHSFAPPAALAAAGLLALCAAVSGCAGRPAAPKPASPEARLAIGEIAFLDQHRLTVPLTLTLRNPGSEGLMLESAECSLSIQGAAAPIAARLAQGAVLGRSLEPGSGERKLAFEASVDVRELAAAVSGPEGPASVSFSCSSRARLVAADGRPIEAAASAEGSFPIIREPRFRIRSLKIERDILVTTNLRLELEIENPNDFPIDFSGFAYRFYGEGKSWAEGSFGGLLSIPERSTEAAPLAFEMNFADRDRKLLDLVAELRVVRYELRGKAKVATGLAALPEFGIEVDEEGSCQVER
jgi:LEA14-like dessication related protein